MAKEKNGTLRLILSIFGVLVVLIGAAVGYGMLCNSVYYTAEEVRAEIKPRMAAHDKEISELKIKTEVIETRQKAILEGVQNINKKLDNLMP